MIGIIDYGLSNIRSVACALKKIEVEYKVIDNNKSIRDFSGYILPGVGAYNEAMKNIKSKGTLIIPTKSSNEVDLVVDYKSLVKFIKKKLPGPYTIMVGYLDYQRLNL